ncbi:DUF3043 domain-containing protein [Cryptosporangium arvum]|uniref:DUF3043 domain-containing protein n=1 Tax=Cryptosporangium arvum DSM 44712 TaxID=927661 RepID=A0A010ZQB0_9ACTN|nr:DUF3043 domain-containing protein [Cryptosporangium arvum]EXG80854.1 Protein of unknown function (DUF3043) [Cryptosporangium arvum DSM 44712]
MSLLRRKSTPVSDEVPETVEPVSEPSGKAYTPGKGRPTPKRTANSRPRNVTAAAGPTDKKAMRAKMREERSKAYEGMRRGEEKYLSPRDKGPVRRLVRDLVDARRNVGSYFLVGALAVLLFSQPQWPSAVRFGANILWLLLIVAILADVFLISRLIRKNVRERFPNAPDKMGGLTFYGVMRSVQFRRMRTPGPQVKIGEKV